MKKYQVDGTVRKKECDKDSPISHLTLVEPAQAWKSETIIKLIEEKDENKKASFWSYHYKDGKIDDETEIEVEVVDDSDGKYLRTRKDETEDNNLLELPIYHKKKEGKGFTLC